MSRIVLSPFMRWAQKLRHPTLFKITAVLFVIDLLIPNGLPFDDIILGLATMGFANWKTHSDANRQTVRSNPEDAIDAEVIDTRRR